MMYSGEHFPSESEMSIAPAKASIEGIGICLQQLQERKLLMLILRRQSHV